MWQYSINIIQCSSIVCVFYSKWSVVMCLEANDVVMKCSNNENILMANIANESL